MSEAPTNQNYSERVEGLPAWVKVLASLAIVFVLLGALVFGGSFLRSETGPLVATEPPPPLVVETLRLVEETSFDSARKFTGIIRAKRTARLSFAVGGQVSRVFVQEGERVAKGKPIAKVDMRTEQARLAAAVAQTRSAQASLNLAQTELARQKNLLAKGHISQQRVDNAQAGLDVAQTQVDAATSAADAIRVAIGLGTLTAPFDGLVTRRFIDEGASTAPSAPIVELVEAGKAELVLGLPVSFAADLVAGQPYEFASSTGQFSGVYRNNAGIIDRANRTLKTYFDVVPSDAALIGDIVSLTLKNSVAENGFSVPRVALTAADRGLWAIFVVTGEGDNVRVERRPVEVLYTQVNTVFVRGPLTDGAQIVSQGVERLVDGQRVAPRDLVAARPTTG